MKYATNEDMVALIERAPEEDQIAFIARLCKDNGPRAMLSPWVQLWLKTHAKAVADMAGL